MRIEIYSKNDRARRYKEFNYPHGENGETEYRTEFRRDLARVIHSHSFRRLTGKTQLFPYYESDFFRNRLTHSLEVAQIAKSITLKINKHIDNEIKHLKKTKKLDTEFDPETLKINLDLIELAGLAHDIGHPPFGHQGEEMLAKKMKDHGGFEGNAQTLRILSKIEKKIINSGGLLANGGFSKGAEDESTKKFINKKDYRGGLNLTYRSLASILKYDANIAKKIATKKCKCGECKKEQNCKNGECEKQGWKNEECKKYNELGKYVFKGYYDEESDLVELIKKNVAGNPMAKNFKTIECQIMDLADDITYSTYDLEDAFKAGFISPTEIFAQDKKFFKEIKDEVNLSGRKQITERNIKDIISDLFEPIFTFQDEEIENIDLERIDRTSPEYTFLKNQYTTRYNDLMTQNGYVRGHFSSQLISETIDAINFEFNSDNPVFSKIWLDPVALTRVEVLKRVSFKTQILSPRLQIQELRGKRIVGEIFDFLIKEKDDDGLPKLLPDDYKLIYLQKPDNEQHQYRTICDYIACMTDRYAIEFHGRITSENPSSIFKSF